MATKEKILVHLDKFPPLSAFSDCTDFKNSLLTLKYHFCTKDTKFFIMLNDNFTLEKRDHSFYETFYDDDEFSNIKENIWLKNASNEETNLKKTSKKVIVKMGQDHLVHVETFDTIPAFSRTIKLKIKRTIFKHKFLTNIKITKDKVEFENEDIFEVFAFSASIPENELQQLKYRIDQQKTDLGCFPARSKILEYLFRYEPRFYKFLEFKGHIPSTHFSESDMSDKPSIYQKAFGIRYEECMCYKQELESYSHKTLDVLNSMTTWPDCNFIEFKEIGKTKKRLRLSLKQDLESKLLQMKKDGTINDFNLDLAFERHFIRLFVNKGFENSSLSPYINNGSIRLIEAKVKDSVCSEV